MTDLQVPDRATAPAEPLLTVGGIVAVATGLLALLIAFGVPLTNTQQAALLGLLAVLAPAVTAAVGRGRVWSPKSVAAVAATKSDGLPL